MDNRYFDKVIGEMKPFLEEQGFKFIENKFENDEKIISVNFDDARQMYTLSIAEKSEEDEPAFSEISAWLFDDSQNEKDAVSVGIDFVATLRKELNVKIKRTVNSSSVDLPTASKSDNMNITAFTKKMLDIFPSLKDEYKAHVSVYGNFLYLNFFGEHLVPLIKNLFETGTKKQINKFYVVLEDGYVKGDKDTVNVMVAVLCASSYNNETVKNGIKEMLAENKHFLTSFEGFLPVLSNNKKLLNALVKG